MNLGKYIQLCFFFLSFLSEEHSDTFAGRKFGECGVNTCLFSDKIKSISMFFAVVSLASVVMVSLV